MPKYSPLTNDLQMTEALNQYSLVRKEYLKSSETETVLSL